MKKLDLIQKLDKLNAAASIKKNDWLLAVNTLNDMDDIKICHIYPRNDIFEHTLTENCSCNPSKVMYLFEDNNMIFIHNSWDNREEQERIRMINNFN